jgi:tRNA threonylcarbamoyladenosine biosynthesis protein TsaE
MLVPLEKMADFARSFCDALPPAGVRAHVVGLVGDLGAGKTTFVQHVASVLGVTDAVLSPTYVFVQSHKTAHPVFTTLVHIDAYRLKPGEARTIGWSALLTDPYALVLVEWPERLQNEFPAEAPRILFSVTSDTERDITYA